MTAEDIAVLEDSIDEVRTIPARTIVIRRDERFGTAACCWKA